MSYIDTTAESVSVSSEPAFRVKRPGDFDGDTYSPQVCSNSVVKDLGRTPSAGLQATVKTRAGGSLMDAHRQWATRPADEAVFTFDDLLARTRKARFESRELAAQKWSHLRVEASGDEILLGGRNGGGLLTHHSMSRLCGVAGAPAEYLAKLPTRTVVECLNHGLENVETNGSVELLVNDTNHIRAMTSQRYERVWDHEIASLAHGLHRNGTWGACEAFKSAEQTTVSNAWGQKKALPLGWVGDRSSFIALADYDGAVKVNGTLMARFALLSNSEVGAASLKIVFGLMDFACANFILWGCTQVTEISIRHTGSIRDRWQALTAPMQKRLSSGEKDEIASGMTLASRTLIADTQAETFERATVVTKLPKSLLQDAWNRAEATPRYGDPRSVYGLMSGLTEASQDASHADRRFEIDTAAARLMSLI